MKKICNAFVAITFAAATLFFALPTTSAAAQEAMPAPGTVIDKSNIETYKHLFPEEFLEAFRTGFGLIAPISITVAETKPNAMPATFLAESAKNKGKYGIDAEGYISGGPEKDIVGFPFPDVAVDDPKIGVKIMWNYDYRYVMDDSSYWFVQFEKRANSPVSVVTATGIKASFQGRMFDDPKPLMETPNNVRSAEIIQYMSPSNQRNFMMLLFRYIDQRASDTNYLYLPSMRRVLRGEAGERSTPIMSSTNAPDDFNGGFYGRVPEFTYNYIGEQKVLSINKATLGFDEMSKVTPGDYIPLETEGWEVRDAYIIDILPKNPKYPMSKKRFYLDKESMSGLYTIMYDRSGKIWKVWQTTVTKLPVKSGNETVPAFNGMLGMDVQLQYGANMYFTYDINEKGYNASDFSLAALRKRGR